MCVFVSRLQERKEVTNDLTATLAKLALRKITIDQKLQQQQQRLTISEMYDTGLDLSRLAGAALFAPRQQNDMYRAFVACGIRDLEGSAPIQEDAMHVQQEAQVVLRVSDEPWVHSEPAEEVFADSGDDDGSLAVRYRGGAPYPARDYESPSAALYHASPPPSLPSIYVATHVFSGPSPGDENLPARLASEDSSPSSASLAFEDASPSPPAPASEDLSSSVADEPYHASRLSSVHDPHAPAQPILDYQHASPAPVYEDHSSHAAPPIYEYGISGAVSALGFDRTSDSSLLASSMSSGSAAAIASPRTDFDLTSSDRISDASSANSWDAPSMQTLDPSYFPRQVQQQRPMSPDIAFRDLRANPMYESRLMGQMSNASEAVEDDEPQMESDSLDVEQLHDAYPSIRAIPMHEINTDSSDEPDSMSSQVLRHLPSSQAYAYSSAREVASPALYDNIQVSPRIVLAQELRSTSPSPQLELHQIGRIQPSRPTVAFTSPARSFPMTESQQVDSGMASRPDVGRSIAAHFPAMDYALDLEESLPAFGRAENVYEEAVTHPSPIRSREYSPAAIISSRPPVSLRTASPPVMPSLQSSPGLSRPNTGRTSASLGMPAHARPTRS